LIVKTAMVLAAGLGTRMRPLTDDRPKALVTVRGRALIDHVLDRMVEAGVERAIVNVHAFADMLEAHVRKRRDIEIIVSDERALLMETGGGVKQARRLLGDAPIFLLAGMDQQLGYDGAGDFVVADDGAIAFRDERATSPWAYMGAQVIDPAIVDIEPLEPFSFTRIWRRLASEGRLYGAPLGGFWMHVGDPRAREAAEARLSDIVAAP
jgi:MurNAc alpha-1-phosphate uridylyltransferase